MFRFDFFHLSVAVTTRKICDLIKNEHTFFSELFDTEWIESQLQNIICDGEYCD